MKKFVATILLIGTAFTASACSTNNNSKGYVDQAPYADERTVGHERIAPVAEKVAPAAEKIFARKQMK